MSIENLENREEGQEIDEAGLFTEEEIQIVDDMLNFPGTTWHPDSMNKVEDKKAIRNLIDQYKEAREKGDIKEKRRLELELVDIKDAQ